MTVRAYMDLLKFEDKIRSRPLYFKTAAEAVKVYIKLFDKPLEDEQEKENIDLGTSERCILKNCFHETDFWW
jgi:peptide alpha-N-acetyltransferase